MGDPHRGCAPGGLGYDVVFVGRQQLFRVTAAVGTTGILSCCLMAAPKQLLGAFPCSPCDLCDKDAQKPCRRRSLLLYPGLLELRLWCVPGLECPCLSVRRWFGALFGLTIQEAEAELEPGGGGGELNVQFVLIYENGGHVNKQEVWGGTKAAEKAGG